MSQPYLYYAHRPVLPWSAYTHILGRISLRFPPLSWTCNYNSYCKCGFFPPKLNYLTPVLEMIVGPFVFCCVSSPVTGIGSSCICVIVVYEHPVPFYRIENQTFFY